MWVEVDCKIIIVCLSGTTLAPSTHSRVQFTFNITVDGTDQDGKELACITFDIKII